MTETDSKPPSSSPGIYRAFDPTQSSDPQAVYSHTADLQTIITEGEQDTSKYVYANYGVGAKTQSEEHDSHPKRRMICGLSLPLFGLIIALVTITIAGAVGGGVAGSMASRNCRRELTALRQDAVGAAATTASKDQLAGTATSPAAASATPVQDNQQIQGRIEVPKTGCPGSNGTLYTTTVNTRSTTFMRICNSVKGGPELFQISTPSWDSCMDACAEYAEFFDALSTKGATPQCAGVSYVPEWSIHPEYAVGNYSTRGSCWLKFNMDGLAQNGWHLWAEVVSSVRQE